FVYVFYRYQLSSRLEHAENLRLKELDSVKSRLYTNITHEFRTPLTVINGMAEQIIEPEESRKMILHNSQHLLRLVNQMLDLAKLESGKLELNLVLGNIIAYLQYLVESFHSFAASKNIELVFYPEMGEFLMDYDEEKLQHIISNLLSNAIKFSPEGSKIILHVSEDKTKDSEFLLIKVKDKGIGIAPDKLPHIFDRFYQVDDSSTRKGEGTGIGLTLTRELIHLMGGNITVESKVNAGTTFMVSLPVSRSAAPVTDIPRSEVSTMGLPVGRMAEDILTANEDFPVVLIIEDNPDVVFYIKTCLKDQYQIMTAENGALGIQKALDQIPDLIISDVMMPEK
ncbi:MAG: hybrid sensor histidine kinase/response regulator, partial [Bacteroidetes bacterium]|nr:hybrid sensor histidine kinase/response regulator [Bacteroidota bacterium]